MNVDILWKPRPSDVEWTANMIRMLNDGGSWVIPMNQSVWKIDKKRKVFVCIHGANDDMFHKITVCCRQLEYTTEYAPGSDPISVDMHMCGTTKTSPRLGNPNN